MRPSSIGRSLGLACAVLLVAACDRSPRPIELRHVTPSYYLTVSSDPVPPRAREQVRYKVVVRERESRQPIENGEGRIYSSNRDEAKTWDALQKAPEPGTYYGTLNFVTSGEWAVAIEFRRDSTSRLEKIEWMQEVLAAREPLP